MRVYKSVHLKADTKHPSNEQRKYSLIQYRVIGSDIVDNYGELSRAYLCTFRVAFQRLYLDRKDYKE